MTKKISPSSRIEAALILKAKLLDQPGIHHGFTTRGGGFSVGPWRGLNLSMDVGDSATSVAKNSSYLSEHAGFNLESVVWLKQVHGRQVLRVDSLQGIPPESERLFDASISDQPGVVLAVLIADCLPILVLSTTPRAVCVIHAGWRGTLQDVTGAAIRSLCDNYGCQPAGLFAAIGPCIHACCYNVDTDLFEQFRARFGQRAVSGECAILRVDLVAANLMLLEAAGVPPTQIEVLDLCTSCREDLFFSYRRDKGQTGRQMAFIEQQIVP